MILLMIQGILLIKFKITLEEALLGFSKEIIHLDSHAVLLERDKVTQPGEIQRIPKEGMPHHEYSSNFGVAPPHCLFKKLIE